LDQSALISIAYCPVRIERTEICQRTQRIPPNERTNERKTDKEVHRWQFSVRRFVSSSCQPFAELDFVIIFIVYESN
jgi:hypothetical protein